MGVVFVFATFPVHWNHCGIFPCPCFVREISRYEVLVPEVKSLDGKEEGVG